MHCGINMLCFVLKLFFGWIFRTLGKCSEYPDTHIKVLTKEHFNNRCLHSENNGSHKAPSGTLERRKQSQNHISALSAEWDLSVPHLSTIARGDGCDQVHRCPAHLPSSSHHPAILSTLQSFTRFNPRVKEEMPPWFWGHISLVLKLWWKPHLWHCGSIFILQSNISLFSKYLWHSSLWLCFVRKEAIKTKLQKSSYS